MKEEKLFRVDIGEPRAYIRYEIGKRVTIWNGFDFSESRGTYSFGVVVALKFQPVLGRVVAICVGGTIENYYPEAVEMVRTAYK